MCVQIHLNVVESSLYIRLTTLITYFFPVLCVSAHLYIYTCKLYLYVHANIGIFAIQESHSNGRPGFTAAPAV
jgi:hypothetical protein